MSTIDFNNKEFILVDNSEKGSVDAQTFFKFKQNGTLVTADYSGGTIKHGSIVAHLKNDTMELLYHCMTTENELMAGKALARVSFSRGQKIRLHLDWKWISGGEGSGKSEYIEA